MPAYSTLDLIYEVFEAIASLNSLQFTLNQLVNIINENRKNRSQKRKVTKESVNRILTKLWLPLGIHLVTVEMWEKGTGPIRGVTRVRPEIVEKVIQNEGIDATPTEIDYWIGLGEIPTTRKAYICYPYRNNPLKHSLELLILLIHLYPKAKDTFVPATPHEMYWGLEERKTREIAMSECKQMIKKCDFMLNCQRRGETPSSGMKRDIDIALEENPPKSIKYIEDILGYYPNVHSAMISSGLAELVTVSETPKIIPAIAISNSQKKKR